MLTWFNAEVEVYELADELCPRWQDERVGEILDALDGFAPALGVSERGWWAVRISLQAESLIDASAQALVVVREATGCHPIWCEVMTEPEFHARFASRDATDS